MAQRSVQSAASAEATIIGDRFRVDRPLGRGGMGEVLAVTETRTGKRFALKRLLPGAEARHAMALSREFHRLASLKHPHIVEAFDFGLSEGAPYYTMELLSGSDVDSLAPLPWPVVAAILRDVASALGALHARRLVHRDVSGRNVWRTSEGVVKLIDFGTMTTFGVANQLAGTLPYLAPEALRTHLLDQRSDLYSLGALGYQLLTGRHAYPARSLSELEQHWSGGAVSLQARLASTSRADLPPLPEALEHLIEAAMALDPEARPASATEVLERLSAVLPDEAQSIERQAATATVRGAAFAGRAAERARFMELLRRAMRGEGASAVLLGPRGVGRTRLLEELAIEARVAGAVVVSLGADEGREGFSVAQRALLALFEAAPNEAKAAASPHRAVLGHLSDEVREALEVEPSRLEQFPELLGEARVRMQGALHAFFRALTANKPVVLLLDDLQAMDEASIGFFSSLARDARDRQLLIVAGIRSEDERVVPGPTKPFADRATVIALQGLSTEETEDMLRSVFGEAPLLRRTSAFLWEKSLGNPGQLADLCDYLQESEQIRHSDGLWVLPQETSELKIPSSLAQLDEAKLERLEEDDRALAEALSVLKRAISLELCSRISPLPPERTFAALARLCSAGILVHGGDGYSFRTPELRIQLERGLPAEVAKRAHETAGEALLARENPDFTARIAAGLHLLRGGATRRGAVLVHETVLEAVAELSDDNLQNAPEVEDAYRLALELSLRPHERLSFLCLLAWSGYFVDRKLGTTYGDEALACAQEVCGMNLARKLRPWLGRKLALIVSLIIAGARLRRLSKKSVLAIDIGRALKLFTTAAASLSGMYALCMTEEKVRACADAIEPLSALGPDHAAGIVHRFSLGCAELLTNRVSDMRSWWAELLERLESPKPIAGLSDSTRLYYRAACLYCWGSAEVWRDKSRTLELADRLEAQPIKLYQVSADQLRAVYYAQQGNMAEAARHRARVEMRALQRGATWQVELWEPASSVPIAARQGDVISIKRAAGQLRHLAASTPSLAEYADAARGSYLLLRRRYQESIAILERVAREQSSRAIGHANLVGALAQAYNALGRHGDAERVAAPIVASLSTADVAPPGLTLRLQIELALAEAGLGRHSEAIQRLDKLIAQHSPNEGPLTLGALHDARARVALAQQDEAGADEHFAQMERWYRSTDCPSLVQYCDRVARRRLQGEVAALDTAWGSSTHTTDGSYQASPEEIARLLTKVLASTTSKHWVLRWSDPANDQRSVQASKEVIEDDLLAWLDDRISASNDDMTDTLDTEDADSADDGVKWLGGEKWVSALIVDDAGGVLGALALCDAAQLPPLDLLRTLGGHLKRSPRSTLASIGSISRFDST